MSSASMLLEVSIATTISNPRSLVSCQSNPHCGRASAKIKQTTASTKRARRTCCRLLEIPTVKPGNNRAAMNCVSSCCRLRPDHQKNATNAGGTSSSSQRSCGLAKVISLESKVLSLKSNHQPTSWQPPQDCVPQKNFQQQQAKPR